MQAVNSSDYAIGQVRRLTSYWEGIVSIYLFSLRAVPIFKASIAGTWTLVVC
jgi:hypothetical protein